MRLRAKLITGMCLLLLAICLGVLGTVRYVLLPQVESLERNSLMLDLERSHKAIIQEQDRLMSIAIDWAQWDDTYQFVQDQNEAYVASNLAADFLSPLRADFFIIHDGQGRLLVSLFSDRVARDGVGFLAGPVLEGDNPIARLEQSGAPLRAMWHSAAGAFLVAGHPITDSFASQPAKGVLYFGRLLDQDFIASLGDLLRLPLSVSVARSEVSVPTVRFVSDNEGTATLPLAFSNTDDLVMVLALASPRPFYQKALEGALYAEVTIFFIGLLATIAAYVFFKQTLVSPIIQLQQRTEALGRGERASHFRFANRRDELGKLARAFQLMVENVEENQRVLRVERNEFLKVSLTDPLTGLRNRRYLERYLANPDSWADGKGYLFMFIDIDFFKRVNDVHGHDVGDAVIRQVGACIKACCRDSDILVRMGGEEFAVLSLNCDVNAGGMLAERICQSVAEHRFGLPDSGIAISCSIGFYAVAANQVADPVREWPEMLKGADLALYAVKRNGRDNWIGLSWRVGEGHVNHPQGTRDVEAGLQQGKLRLISGELGDREIRWGS